MTSGAANVRGIGGASPALALWLLLGACAAPSPPPPAPAPAAPPAWNIGSSTWQRIEGDCDGPTGCLSVHLEYPRILAAPGGPEAAAALDRFVRVDLLAAAFGQDEGTPEHLTTRLTGEMRSLLAENPDISRHWWVRQKIDVLHKDAQVFSLRCRTETYLAGERPLEELRLASFDSRTGARLRLEDLVDLDGDGRERFLRRVEEQLRADREIPPDRTLAEAGFAQQDGHLPLPTEFALAPEGLVLHWGLFVLGSEELGEVTVVVPQ